MARIGFYFKQYNDVVTHGADIQSGDDTVAGLISTFSR